MRFPKVDRVFCLCLSVYICRHCLSLAFVRAGPFETTGMMVTFGGIVSTLTFVSLVYPPSVTGHGGVVGDSVFGRRVNQFLNLELRVPLKTFVGEQFHHLFEGECPIDVSLRTGYLDGVVGILRSVTLSRNQSMHIHVGDKVFEEIDAHGDVGPWTCLRFSMVVRRVLPRCLEKP